MCVCARIESACVGGWNEVNSGKVFVSDRFEVEQKPMRKEYCRH